MQNTQRKKFAISCDNIFHQRGVCGRGGDCKPAGGVATRKRRRRRRRSRRGEEEEEVLLPGFNDRTHVAGERQQRPRRPDRVAAACRLQPRPAAQKHREIPTQNILRACYLSPTKVHVQVTHVFFCGQINT